MVMADLSAVSFTTSAMVEKISPGAKAITASPMRWAPAVVFTVGPTESQLRTNPAPSGDADASAVEACPSFDQWYAPGRPEPGVFGVNSRSNSPNDARV